MCLSACSAIQPPPPHAPQVSHSPAAFHALDPGPKPQAAEPLADDAAHAAAEARANEEWTAVVTAHPRSTSSGAPVFPLQQAFSESVGGLRAGRGLRSEPESPDGAGWEAAGPKTSTGPPTEAEMR